MKISILFNDYTRQLCGQVVTFTFWNFLMRCIRFYDDKSMGTIHVIVRKGNYKQLSTVFVWAAIYLHVDGLSIES